MLKFTISNKLCNPQNIAVELPTNSPTHQIKVLSLSLSLSRWKLFPFPVMLLLFLLVSSFIAASAGDFYQEFDLTWGDKHAEILDGGKLLTLTLDKTHAQVLDPREGIYLEE